MSRGLWFAAGAGAGIYAMIRGRRAAEALTIDGLRDRAGAAAVGLRMFGEEVVAGKAEREATLRDDLARRTGELPGALPGARRGTVAGSVGPSDPVADEDPPVLASPPGRHAGPPETDPPTHSAPSARHQMED